MKKKALFVAVTVVLVTAIDLITKHLAATRISPYEPIEILPFLNLVNVQNRGAAFGMLSAFGSWFFIAISISAIAFIIYLLVKTDESPLALALIISGALGNLADRLMLGHVRDFLDVHAGGHHWPAFNVADSALTVGLALIIVLPIIHGMKEKKETGSGEQ